MQQSTSVESRVLKMDMVNWRAMDFIQHEQFKEWSEADKHKLKASILSENFIEPFNVWEDENGKIWCLDGKHRNIMLEELVEEGFNIPYQLPANFIKCKDKKEAAKLVLLYSSSYAKVTRNGFAEFMENYDLEFADLKEQMNLEDFSIARFEQEFDRFDTDSLLDDPNAVDVEGAEIPLGHEPVTESPAQLGDIYQLGRHRLVCGSCTDVETVETLMNGEKARIMMTDPPYNLPANAISNKGENKHADFAMGAGEMSEEEFKDFMALIMKFAQKHSVDGAIHYIWMDFRHAWHMCQASMEVYGSLIPKQVCVWKKDVFANGSFYRAQHEFCFIFKSGKEKHLSHLVLKDRVRSNIWEYPSANSRAEPDTQQALKEHPTPKNVKMIADAILDTTNEDDIVIDFFLGSGTTLLACEQTDRICYATEIEPKYIHLIVRRWVAMCYKNGIEPDFKHLNGDLRLEDFS